MGVLFFKTKIHNYAKTGKSVLYLGRIRAVIFLPILWEGYFQKTKQTNHQFPLPERIAISKHTAQHLVYLHCLRRMLGCKMPDIQEITFLPSPASLLTYLLTHTFPPSLHLPGHHLVDNIDAVVQLLTLQDWVQVIQPVLEVFLPFSEWNNDGHLVRRDAVLGRIATAHLHLRVLLRHKCQVHRHIKLDQQGADQRGGGKEKLAGHKTCHFTSSVR